MSAISASNSGPAPQPSPSHDSFRLFGVPLGDFGLFASMLISCALGFMAFFGVTFLSIFGLMIYNRAGEHHVTLDTSYKFIALPAGIFVLIVSFAGLFILWLRRKLTSHS
jgi:nitrate reductase gamma subunit